MYTNIFDTHAHYDHKLFNYIRHATLSSMPEFGVSLILNCGSNEESSEYSATLAAEYDYIFSTAGIHPHDSARVTTNWQENIRSLLMLDKTVAVGEIGLDYHYNYSDPATQRKVFAKSLEIAVELNLPVVVHDRDAHEDITAMLKEYRPDGVVHRFSGSIDMMEQLEEIGMYFGFGCSIVYDNALTERNAVSSINVNRLLLETDCPYLPPPTNKDELCRSDMILFAAETISELRPSYTTQEIIDIASENGKRLFSL